MNRASVWSEFRLAMAWTCLSWAARWLPRPDQHPAALPVWRHLRDLTRNPDVWR